MKSTARVNVSITNDSNLSSANDGPSPRNSPSTKTPLSKLSVKKQSTPIVCRAVCNKKTACYTHELSIEDIYLWKNNLWVKTEIMSTRFLIEIPHDTEVLVYYHLMECQSMQQGSDIAYNDVRFSSKDLIVPKKGSDILEYGCLFHYHN